MSVGVSFLCKGENVPANVAQLQEQARERTADLLVQGLLLVRTVAQDDHGRKTALKLLYVDVFYSSESRGVITRVLRHEVGVLSNALHRILHIVENLKGLQAVCKGVNWT